MYRSLLHYAYNVHATKTIDGFGDCCTLFFEVKASQNIALKDNRLNFSFKINSG